MKRLYKWCTVNTGTRDNRGKPVMRDEWVLIAGGPGDYCSDEWIECEAARMARVGHRAKIEEASENEPRP